MSASNSLGYQLRDALQAKIQEITVANGFDVDIALRADDVIAGNAVMLSDKKSFPYVHLGNVVSDYEGMHLPSSTDYPTITMQITAFAKDSRDCEGLVDRLGVAICDRIMDEYTLGGLSWNSFYNRVSCFEESTMPGLGVCIISWWAKSKNKIGQINSIR